MCFCGLRTVDPNWFCVVYDDCEGFVGLGGVCEDEGGEETAGEGVAGVGEGGLGYGVVLEGLVSLCGGEGRGEKNVPWGRRRTRWSRRRLL